MTSTFSLHTFVRALILGLAAVALAPSDTNAATPAAFAPGYQIAPGWGHLTGYVVNAFAEGVVAGQDLRNLPAPFPRATFFDTNGARKAELYLTVEPSTFLPGGAFRSVSRDGDGILFGGQTNGHAFTQRERGMFGFELVSRDLHPPGYLISRIEGVSLTTNGPAWRETAVGSVVNGFVPEAAWWENGVFRLLSVPPLTAFSSAHAVSGYSLYEEYPLRSIRYREAEMVVGEYGPNGVLVGHACVWFRDYPNEESYELHDIHPTNFFGSRVLGIGDVFAGGKSSSAQAKRLVGEGRSDRQSGTHALVWNFDEQFKAHDVHPAAYQSSTARATENNRTIGVATTFDGHTHAMLWMQYTPLDLHGYFPGAVDSEATGVTGDGRIAGWWRDASDVTHAYLLLPELLNDTSSESGSVTMMDERSLESLGLEQVDYSFSVINDAGVTAFVARGMQNQKEVLFTRAPGGPPVPRAATGQPLGGSLITSFRVNGNRFALDDSGTIHTWLGVSGGSGGPVAIASFRPDGSSKMIARVGDALPDGQVLDGIRDFIVTADGRIAILTGRNASDLGHSIVIHQSGTNVVVVRNDYSYPTVTNTPNNFAYISLRGMASNGDVFFSAGRHGVDEDGGPIVSLVSLWRWRHGVVTEVAPLGTDLGDGWRLGSLETYDGLTDAIVNAAGDILLDTSAHHSSGRDGYGLWRLKASKLTWEQILVNDDLIPGGVALSHAARTFNANGEAIVEVASFGEYRLLLSRPAAPLEAFAPAMTTDGQVYFGRDSLNRHGEGVGVRSFGGVFQRLELFAPRPRVVNARSSATGMTFDVQAPILNRPYDISFAPEATGPWYAWPAPFMAKSALTPFTDPNPTNPAFGFAYHRYFRAVRLP